MIKEVLINEAQDLIRELNSLGNNYIYRGHADSRWTLQSTLERTAGHHFSDAFVEKWEQYSLSVFMAKFHIYDTQNEGPGTKLGWLSIMQHYGVPTRLLDFTTSPYIALYFAMEGYDPRSPHDFAVYAIDYSAMMKVSTDSMKRLDREFVHDNMSMTLQSRQDEVFEKWVDRFTQPILWVTEPSKSNVRIERQSGCFLLTGSKSLSINDAVALPEYAAVNMVKFAISASLFESVYALLRKMNISATTIYGDLAGVASSLRAEARVRTTG